MRDLLSVSLLVSPEQVTTRSLIKRRTVTALRLSGRVSRPGLVVKRSARGKRKDAGSV